jgi:hypothetical protein
MLQYLHLENVGPASKMRMDLGPRLNVITGDNGLGKSFLLDVAWWALTRTWTGNVALPRQLTATPAKIAFGFNSKSKGVVEYSSTFNRKEQSWLGKQGRPPNPGLVVYARVDGGFAVWDPARNYWKSGPRAEAMDRPAAYQFTAQQVWDGIADGNTTLCNGLIRDWAAWQKEKGTPYEVLKAALKGMSPSDEEPLVPGELTRISLDDVRDMPTLRLPYAGDVPIVHASAGMRRIVALVYLLVWTWEEHKRAAKILGEQPTQQIIFLIDELDTHLHPRWQRKVLSALLNVVNELITGGTVEIQVVAATHSPLVLASLEPMFDDEKDALWHLELKNRRVSLRKEIWAKHGDAHDWLVSQTFGLKQARSIEGERVIEAAEAFMRGALSELPAGLKTHAQIHKELQEQLPGHDIFWPRWIVSSRPVKKATK